MKHQRLPHRRPSPLVAPYCAILRDYLSDTPYCALWCFWCLNMTNWLRYPPPLSELFPLESMRSGGAIPPPPDKRGISAILAQYHMKNKARRGAIPLSAILSRKGIAGHGGISQPLSEHGFAYDLQTETCQSSKNLPCEAHGQGKATYLV